MNFGEAPGHAADVEAGGVSDQAAALPQPFTGGDVIHAEATAARIPSLSSIGTRRSTGPDVARHHAWRRHRGCDDEGSDHYPATMATASDHGLWRMVIFGVIWSRNTCARTFVLQTFIVLALCFVRVWPWRSIAGNEMDTVAAARQWVDGGWLPQDWYLNLDIPYRVPFNLLTGPISAHWGLGAGAAAGRLVSYILFAIAVVALLRALRINPWLALLPLAVFLDHQGLAAGEWMVGTAEAKTLAYPAVIGSLAAVLADRPKVAAALVGAALSCHVLIGLMGFGALIVAVVVARVRGGCRPVARVSKSTVGTFVITGGWGLWVLVRTLLAGLFPAATAGWDVYVSFRVPHHTLPSHWQLAPLVPWQVWLIGAALVGMVLVWRGTHRWSIIGGFTLAGCALYVCGLALVAWGDIGHLRYYWFRLADTWIPLLTVLLVAGVLTQLTRRAGLARSIAVVCAVGTVAVALPATLDTHASAARSERAWSASDAGRTLQWLAMHLPDDAVVAADPDQQQQWYPTADRAAWVLYKSSPQSGMDVLTWSSRLEMTTETPITATTTRRQLTQGHRSLGPDALRQLHACGVTHYVARRSDQPAGTTLVHREGGWVVLELSDPQPPAIKAQVSCADVR